MTKKATEKPKEPKRTFRIEPDLGCFLWGGVVLVTIIALGVLIDMVYSCIKYPQWFGPCSWENENIRVTASFLLGPLIIAVSTVALAYDSYGKITIWEDRFEFHALFRRPKTIYYTEFKYYGIDYVIEHKLGKVWYIYFRRDKKPEKFGHRPEKGFPTQPFIQLSFREEIYESLIYYLPENMATMLKSCYSCEVVDRYEKFWGVKRK